VPAEVTLTDTVSDYNFSTITEGILTSNRMIDSVTLTITDTQGTVLQQATAYPNRYTEKTTNAPLAFDLFQFEYESPEKQQGFVNLKQLGVGDYHCTTTARLRTGEILTARDFDFTVTEENQPTLTARGPGAVCHGVLPQYIVRRLTPTECARLQGFADAWGHINKVKHFSTEEYEFWKEVRNTHAAINGKKVQDYTEKQMVTWFNKLHTDSSEYKMWGNGIALPTALYVMQGITNAINNPEDEIEDWML
jgi:site-specific DNA-cytosine methylase